MPFNPAREWSGAYLVVPPEWRGSAAEYRAAYERGEVQAAVWAGVDRAQSGAERTVRCVYLGGELLTTHVDPIELPDPMLEPGVTVREIDDPREADYVRALLGPNKVLRSVAIEPSASQSLDR